MARQAPTSEPIPTTQPQASTYSVEKRTTPPATIESFTVVDQHRRDPACEDGSYGKTHFDVVELRWSASATWAQIDGHVMGSNGYTKVPVSGSILACAPEGLETYFGLEAHNGADDGVRQNVSITPAPGCCDPYP